MTRIFLAHASTDTTCAEQIRRDLQAKGYDIWQQPASMQMSDILYPRTVETFIVSSAAFILLWSSNASQSEQVEQQLLFAGRVRKPLIALLLDATPLPNTLLAEATVTVQAPCTDGVTLLLQHPLLPAPDSTDALILLAERVTHKYPRERKEALDDAADLLQHNTHREEVLALLEYVAHNDLMTGVRDKAQEVIDADTQRQTQQSPTPFIKPADSRHIFGVRCKNGHITYFDKRHVCALPKSHVHRLVRRAETELDELDLECSTCHEPLTVRIDCEGYR